MRIVLDTNVLLSGMIRSGGAPGKIIDLVRMGTLSTVVDDRILQEYSEVLKRDYFRRYFTDLEREEILDFLRSNSHYVTAVVVVTDLPDPDDVPFLEVSLSESAPLITGNMKHFPESRRRGAVVCSPSQFLASYGPRL